MEDACGISPSLSPASGRCLPKQPCFVSEVGVVFLCFFLIIFFSWPPFCFPPRSFDAGEGRERQTPVWILTRGEVSSSHPNSQPSPGTGQPQTGPLVCSEIPNRSRLCTSSTHSSLHPLVLDTLGIPRETQGEHRSPGGRVPDPLPVPTELQHSRGREMVWQDPGDAQPGWEQPYLLQHYRLLLLQEGLELGRGEDLLHLLRGDHLRGHHGHGHGDLRRGETRHAGPGELGVASPCQAPRSSLKSLPQMPPVPKSSATCLTRSHHAFRIWARRGHRGGCGVEVANWASRAPSGTGFPIPTPAPSSPARAREAPESWDWAPSLRVWGGEAPREAGQVTAHPKNSAQQRKR